MRSKYDFPINSVNKYIVDASRDSLTVISCLTRAKWVGDRSGGTIDRCFKGCVWNSQPVEVLKSWFPTSACRNDYIGISIQQREGRKKVRERENSCQVAGHVEIEFSTFPSRRKFSLSSHTLAKFPSRFARSRSPEWPSIPSVSHYPSVRPSWCI